MFKRNRLNPNLKQILFWQNVKKLAMWNWKYFGNTRNKEFVNVCSIMCDSFQPCINLTYTGRLEFSMYDSGVNWKGMKIHGR